MYLADRVRNASTVWLGATLGCAQCHDHKFDPYLARDFYSFAAFFADVQEKPVGRREPELPAGRGAAAGGSRRSTREIECAAEARSTRRRPSSRPRRPSGRRRCAAQRAYALDDARARARGVRADGTRVLIQGNDVSVIAATAHGPKPPRGHVHRHASRPSSRGITALPPRGAARSTSCRGGGPGRDAARRLRRHRVRGPGRGRPARCALRHATASTPRGRRLHGRGAPSTGARARRGWAVAAADGDEPPAGRRDGSSRSARARRRRRSRSSCTRTQVPGRTLGRFRLSATTDAHARAHGAGPSSSRPELVAARGPSPRPSAAKDAAGRRWRASTGAIAPELAAARARAARGRAAKRRRSLRGVPQSLRHDARQAPETGADPAARQLAGRVGRGRASRPCRASCRQLGATAGARRRGSTWRAGSSARDNPLTARVLRQPAVEALLRPRPVAKRSTTSARRASGRRTRSCSTGWPSSSWTSGWDVKRLVRTLVTSPAYRQSSRAAPGARRARPRQPAARAAGAASGSTPRSSATTPWRSAGLLVAEVGGPSVKPYQPAGYWAYLNFPPREWDDRHGRGPVPPRALHAGGSGRFLHPSLLAFDAPSREECAAERAALEHAAAGAGAAQRPDLRRGRARLRRADPARGRRERRGARCAGPTRGRCSARRRGRGARCSRTLLRQHLRAVSRATGRGRGALRVASASAPAATGLDAGRARGLDVAWRARS